MAIRRPLRHPIIVLIALLALCAPPAWGELTTDNPHVKVRIAGYDPATHTYTISCDIPPQEPGSQVDPRRFWAIDPIPQGAGPSSHSTTRTFNWTLNPENYTELVHTKALYHIYCEVQNYTAPPGQQNMASEIHVDLRTGPNIDVPNVYALASEGTRVTMKCDPPQGVRDYQLSWSLRSRSGSITFPELANERIVNITLPQAGSGWDVLCTVFDRNTGRQSSWDMPIEAFASGPAYIPTIEGCVPGEPCNWVHPSGVPPNGSLALTVSEPGTQVLLNEVLKGTTGSDGRLAIGNVVPGIYNLVLRKDGYDEISTLVPIAAGQQAARSYTLAPPSTGPDPYNMCHTSIWSLPASCTGGAITQDSGTGCRTIICAGGSGSLTVQACNKPGGTSPQFFEMYKHAQSGSGVRICLGNTCMQGEGYVRGPNFPVCLGNATNTTNATQPIAFASVSPQSDPTMTEGQAQPAQFSYTLSNPSNIPVTRTWLRDGVIVASGTSSYAFAAPNGSAGQHVVEARVTSAKNNLSRTWAVTVLAANSTPGNGTNTTNGTCAARVAAMPVTCTGGTITQDTGSGCRTVVCEGAGSSMKVLACDKPTSSSPQFFEMYKQAKTGSGVSRICLGTTCISDNGYAKSGSFPICTGNTSGNGTNTTNTTQQDIAFASLSPGASSVAITEPASQAFSYTLHNPSGLSTTTSWLLNGTPQAASGSTYTFPGGTSTQGTWNITAVVSSSKNTLRAMWLLTVQDAGANQTCVSAVGAMQASCAGGSFTQDTLSGTCRTLVCASGADTLKVLACDKPDTGTKQHFEMYKQAKTGSAVSEICLGATCIAGNGYAKSGNYPICAGE